MKPEDLAKSVIDNCVADAAAERGARIRSGMAVARTTHGKGCEQTECVLARAYLSLADEYAEMMAGENIPDDFRA